MANYADWLRDAERFMRSTCELPGSWGLSIDIGPPAEPARLVALEESLPFGLPPFLRDFYLTASADAKCRYSWNPDREDWKKLAAFTPACYSFYGSVPLIPAAKLAEEQENLFGWAKVFEDYEGAGPATAKFLRECVPLSTVGNGDSIVWHARAAPNAPRVFYASHDADCETEEVLIPLAREGENFLAELPRLGWLGPEGWMLDPFLEESRTGFLDGGCAAAERWRQLLIDFGNVRI